MASNANKRRFKCSSSCCQANRNSLAILLTILLALFGTRHARYLITKVTWVFDASSITNKSDKLALNSTNSHPRIRQIGAVGASSGQQQPQQQELHPTAGRIHTETNMTTRNSEINPRMLSLEELNTTNDHLVVNNNNSDDFDHYYNDSHPLEIPHVMFGDLKYRRVCAHVHSSILCLILRFPFEVPLQDPSVTFPKPFHSHFYHLKSAILVDGPLMEECRNTTTTTTTTNDYNNNNSNNNDYMRECLDNLASKHLPNPDQVVVALWTRQKAPNHPQWNEQIDGRRLGGTLYGTESALQRKRVYDLFHNHVVMALGASPTPQIVSCLSELFGTSCRTEATGYVCAKNMMTPPSGRNKRAKHSPLQEAATATNNATTTSFAEEIFLTVQKYFPTMLENETIPGHVQHIVNTTVPLMEIIRNSEVVKNHMASRAAWARQQQQQQQQGSHPPLLRPLSIIVDFPLAHTQTHFMTTEMGDQVKYNQERMVEMIMNVTTSPAAQQELADLGFVLSSSVPLIVFDGLPHFFPTESGGYLYELQRGSEKAFLDAQGYPGWRPELGSSCRGPLPPNSPLRRINDLERQAFFRHDSFSRHFYGKTWEFTNQFWWQTAKWWRKGNGFAYFDCVHTRKPRVALTRVHKFVLQTMIDDHYETMAAADTTTTTTS